MASAFRLIEVNVNALGTLLVSGQGRNYLPRQDRGRGCLAFGSAGNSHGIYPEYWGGAVP